MADLVSDGKIRVSWVTTISNIAAPTVAELNAGLRLDTQMTPDGLQVTPSTDDVDTSSLSDTYNTVRAGRRGFDNAVTVKRQDTGDTVRATLIYRAAGYLVVRRDLDASTAWATSQKVEVYPSECGEPQNAYGPNTIQAYTVAMKNSTAPNTSATVA